MTPRPDHFLSNTEKGESHPNHSGNALPYLTLVSTSKKERKKERVVAGEIKGMVA
jgi:hypothetical protein